MTNSNLSFLSPISEEDFFKHYFEKQILHVARNNAQFFDAIIQLNDLDEVLNTNDFYFPDINISQKEGQPAIQSWLNSPKRHSSLNINKRELFQHLAEGKTLIMNTVQKRLPKLNQFLSFYEHNWGVDLSANVYLTPAQKQGFNWHYDEHDVFIFQIEGEKKWSIVEETPFLPDANFQAKSPKLSSPEKETEILMKQGDTLYIPRGMYHKAVSTDATSVHVTISLTTTKVYQLFEQFLKKSRAQKPFRKSVLANNLSQLNQQEILEEMKQFANQYFAELNQTDVSNSWKRAIARNGAPKNQGRLHSILKLPELSKDSVISSTPDLNFHHSSNRQFVNVEANGKQLKYPIFMQAALLQMLQAKSLRLSEVDSSIPTKHVLELAKKLIVEGFIILKS